MTDRKPQKWEMIPLRKDGFGMPIWFCRDHCNACNGPPDYLWCAKDRRDKEGNVGECRFEQEWQVCPECKGWKVVRKRECPRCWGEGVIAKEQ